MIKPFAAFDVDGTIFKSSLVEKVAFSCIQAKLFEPEPFKIVFADRRKWQRANNEEDYLEYLDHLIAAFVDQITGVDVEEFRQITIDMIKENRVRKFIFPRKLIKELSDTHYIIAISGSPNFLIEPFLSDLHVDAVFGSEYEQIDGKYTGRSTGVGDKADILEQLIEDGVVKREGSVAIGDTISDLPMLKLAAHPIMFNASHTLTTLGHEMPRVIEVKDMTTCLKYDSSIQNYCEYKVEDIIKSVQTDK